MNDSVRDAQRSSASAICRAISESPQRIGIGPEATRSATVFVNEELHHQIVLADVVERADVGVVLSQIVFASRSKRSFSFGSEARVAQES